MTVGLDAFKSFNDTYGLRVGDDDNSTNIFDEDCRKTLGVCHRVVGTGTSLQPLRRAT
jgi:hypothetical protein